MQLRVLLVAAVAVAAPIEKRGLAQLLGLDATVTVTTTAAATTPTTTAIPVTTAAAVVAAAAATTAATTTSEGLLAKLLGLFDTDATTTAATVAAATTTATSTTTTSSSSGWLSSLLSGLFGKSSSSTTTAATTVAATTTSAAAATIAATSTSANFWANLLGGSSSSSTEVPDFTGLVSVVGAATYSGTATVATLTASLSVSTDTSEIGSYAEKGAGITYSPYTKLGLCKTASEVALDMELLSAYSLIRLYLVDCLGIENVLSAIGSSQKVYLGVWLIDNLSTDLLSLSEQVLTGSRGWSAVHTVAIGNELVNSGSATVAQIQTAVTTARTWFKANAADYSGYIVLVDTLAAMMANPLMCDISDYIAVNCHPYFSGVEALTSGTWLAAQIESLLSTCGNGKTILITESGWPSYGNTVGDAVPSKANQLAAIEGLGNVVGNQVIMFTTYNDYWKTPGSYNVEQSWGIYGDPSV